MNSCSWIIYRILINTTRVLCTAKLSISVSLQSGCLPAYPSLYWLLIMWRYRTEFIITTSIDGHLKFWKKQDIGIEFVKHYRAHLGQVVGVSASADGQLFASVAEDGSAKVFDVINFGKCHLTIR